MELKEFIAIFADQFDETDPSEITADTIYQELDEWSSITVMSIIGFVKTAFNKSITGKQVRSCETVEELYNLINEL